MICDVCQRVVDEAESTDRPTNADGYHHPDEQSFELASTRNCFICQYLWEAAQGGGIPQISQNKTLFPKKQAQPDPTESSFTPQTKRPVTRYGWNDKKRSYGAEGQDQLNMFTPVKKTGAVAILRFIILPEKYYDRTKTAFRGTGFKRY
jgi:hypothetical protein